MKTLVLVLILGFSLSQGEQEKYFPDAYRNVFIGMSLDSLQKLKGGVFESSFYATGKRQLIETPSRDTIVTRVMYLLNKDSLVYEVIIEYKEHFDLQRYVQDLYGAPNHEEDEWLFTLASGRELYIWQYQNRLCIADGSTY